MTRADRTMSEPSAIIRKRSVLFLPAALLLVALGVLVFIVMPARHQKGSGMRTGDFIDTIGVNTHIGSNPYNNPAQLSSLLAYLGVDNVRQSSPIDAASMANIAALGKLGAKIDLIVNGGGPVNLAGAMANVNQLAPYLNAVEGPNEVAIYPIQYGGLSGVDAAVALQKDLYAAVRANPALAQASVYLFTLGGADPSAFPSIGDLSAYTDDANIHSYPPHGLRPIFVIHAAISGGQTDAPSKPVVLTETGFYTLTNGVGWGGVPQSLQASYLLDEVLDEAVAGVQRTYLYDLMDDGVDPNGANQEFHFGLFNNDGTPKLAATAFHNLTTILADSGASSRTFTPDSFAFTATGVALQLHRQHDLVREERRHARHRCLERGAALEHRHADCDRGAGLPGHGGLAENLCHRPGHRPAPRHRSDPDAAKRLDRQPVHLGPSASDRDPSASSGGSTATNPAPPSGLVLNVSEDAWMGDAQFVVHLDGQQVGGVYTATALHAAGQSQAVVLAGTVPDGTHQVSVTFVNDAYGGSTSMDRNLYVDGASYNGQAIAGSTASLLANGTDTFAAAIGTPVSVPAPTSNGLVVTVAEDAWQGDAQFTVTLDGAQVGGLYTATASHAAGQTQAITIASPFAAACTTSASPLSMTPMAAHRAWTATSTWPAQATTARRSRVRRHPSMPTDGLLLGRRRADEHGRPPRVRRCLAWGRPVHGRRGRPTAGRHLHGDRVACGRPVAGDHRLRTTGDLFRPRSRGHVSERRLWRLAVDGPQPLRRCRAVRRAASRRRAGHPVRQRHHTLRDVCAPNWAGS